MPASDQLQIAVQTQFFNRNKLHSPVVVEKNQSPSQVGLYARLSWLKVTLDQDYYRTQVHPPHYTGTRNGLGNCLTKIDPLTLLEGSSHTSRLPIYNSSGRVRAVLANSHFESNNIHIRYTCGVGTIMHAPRDRKIRATPNLFHTVAST